GALLLGGVLVLDDRLDGAVGGPDHPPVAGGVRHLGGQDGHRVALGLVGPDEGVQRPPAQQRVVAVRDDHGAVQGAGLLQRHPDGVARAALVLLDDGLGVRRGLGEVFDDLLAAVADDHHEPFGTQFAGGGQYVAEHGSPAQLVQHLGGAGLHPGALARGENDDGGRAARSAHKEAPRRRGRDRTGVRSPAPSGHGRALRTRHGQDTAHLAPVTPPPTSDVSERGFPAAPAQGFEPCPRAPKTLVLPITPRRIVRPAGRSRGAGRALTIPSRAAASPPDSARAAGPQCPDRFRAPDVGNSATGSASSAVLSRRTETRLFCKRVLWPVRQFRPDFTVPGCRTYGAVGYGGVSKPALESQGVVTHDNGSSDGPPSPTAAP